MWLLVSNAKYNYLVFVDDASIGAGPPSCLIAAWWPKSDRKEATLGVAARLQCEI